jgi:hypothetical protein
VIDLLPFVTGVGEGTKELGVVNKFDDGYDAAKGSAKAVDALKKPNVIDFDSKQLGKKWGKHKTDYPDMKSYTDYKNYAKIFLVIWSRLFLIRFIMSICILREMIYSD